ncbi:CHRD domain-containing protein [Streptomyces sp. NPDC059256]|uniref:CHRD domain-containing protein n=1 Tax=Streptomyces sp. NPDC059256 TaxID=3346794 RepID=UPI0036B7F068
MKCTKNLVIGTTAVMAAAGLGLSVLPAFAADGGQPTGGATHAGHGDADVRPGRGGSTAEESDSRGAALFVASLNGANEVPVPSGPAVGDRDGAALQFVKVHGMRVSVAVKFRGTDKPTALHIHRGARGTNGVLKIDFTPLLARSAPPVKGWEGAVTGTVTVKDKALLDAFRTNPNDHYANLHTARFPGGAVRAQFHKVTTAFPFDKALVNLQASVIRGRQIYRCQQAADGTYAFGQYDVRATLRGPIAHAFVAPGTGTPRWTAPDRSAVTGTLISRTPHGDGNIPELDLRATQYGAKKGLLARTQEILRLNTVGGVAPAGTCLKGAVITVPYRADYVFIQR